MMSVTSARQSYGVLSIVAREHARLCPGGVDLGGRDCAAVAWQAVEAASIDYDHAVANTIRSVAEVNRALDRIHAETTSLAQEAGDAVAP